MKTKKLALMALLTAIALTIFMVEAQIPPLVPLPGVKIGLSNIVTVFAVFALGPKEAASILFCRIFLGSIFAGNFSSILYSAAGGFCAISDHRPSEGAFHEAALGGRRFGRDRPLCGTDGYGGDDHQNSLHCGVPADPYRYQHRHRHFYRPLRPDPSEQRK